MAPPRSKRTAQFKLMLRPELHARIVKAAKKYGRSLNGEIEWRLEQSFGVPLQITSMDLAQAWVDANDRIMALEAKLGEGAYARGELSKGGR